MSNSSLEVHILHPRTVEWRRDWYHGNSHLRAPDGILVSSSKGKRQARVGHFRKLARPTVNEKFDPELEKEIKRWEKENVETPKREGSGSRRMTESKGGEVDDRVAKLRKRGAARAGGRVNDVELRERENQHDEIVAQWDTGKRVRTEEVERSSSRKIIQKGDKTDPGNDRGKTLLLSIVGKSFDNIQNDGWDR